MSVDEHKSISRYRNRDTDDLLGLVSGKVLRENKKKPKGGELPPLKSGGRYGHLILFSEDRRGSRCRCECDCGGVVYLTRVEIAERKRLMVGCLEFDCPHDPDEVKVWRNPTYALWLQLNTLLRKQPKQVDNAWGGEAYDEVPRAPLKEGFANLLECTRDKVVLRTGKWWLSRENPYLPYSEFNLRLITKPEVDLFGSKSRYVMHGGSLYSINNLASMFNLSTHRVQRLKRASPNDETLMAAIMKESEKK